MHRQMVRAVIIFLLIIGCNTVYGQSIIVGPGGKFEKEVLSVPYAFYNESFGFAGAYAYAVTGWPQTKNSGKERRH